MKNEEFAKQAWQTPEVVDLDIEKTRGGLMSEVRETTLVFGTPS